MASSSHQPLLHTSSSTNFNYKFLIFIFFLPSFMFSIAYLAPRLTTLRLSYRSVPPHVCELAYDRQECLSMLSEAAYSEGGKQLYGLSLLQTLLKRSIPQMKMAMEVSNDMKNRVNDVKDRAALADCVELLDLSTDPVADTLESLASWNTKAHADARTMLSGVLTNHFTCLDGINHLGQASVEGLIQDLVSRTRTSLAVLAGLSASDTDNLLTLKRGFPWWVLAQDKKLVENPSTGIEANVVVAQDGTGDYMTIQEAVDSAPNTSSSRYMIYVKSGTYVENVEVGKKKINLIIFGDGMNSTIITGNRSVGDGSTTFKSATLAVSGSGFILQDICVQNTAGPEKYQAVALRVSADQCVINRCRIDAYQDTLYPHSYRQFYRDCLISGTIDFIFGNAAVVLQNCQIIARKPMEKQENMVTAQGRTDPNQNTGTSIQNCEIIASSELENVQESFRSYLGRPWQEYSRTVVMQSYIGSFIDPAGWAEWDGDFALKTLYYGEYANRGPGANTSQRVNWTGYHVITDPSVAKNFTVAELIQGDEWLEDTGVPYTLGV